MGVAASKLGKSSPSSSLSVLPLVKWKKKRGIGLRPWTSTGSYAAVVGAGTNPFAWGLKPRRNGMPADTSPSQPRFGGALILGRPPICSG
jgi:hypothetical protein